MGIMDDLYGPDARESEKLKEKLRGSEEAGKIEEVNTIRDEIKKREDEKRKDETTRKDRKKRIGGIQIGVRICGILFAVWGALTILGALTGLMLLFDGDYLILALLIGVVEIAVAWGILTLQKWARFAGIISAIMFLISISIAIIIGLIVLYFLLIDKETVSEFK